METATQFTISDTPKDLPPKLPYNKKKIILLLLGLIVALGVAFSAVWVVQSRGLSGELLSPFIGDKDSPFSSKSKKNVMQPLTGELYTEEESASWKDLRPLGVMVNNHVDARPQSGLIYADVIYEIVAEGGITRFLSFFLTNTPEKIGPVRSTREYYLVLVKELGDAMIMHIGWSPQALEAIETWPVRSLGRGGGTFWRDNPRDVAIEHTAYTNGKELREVGATLGWEGTREFEAWLFKDDMNKYNSFPDAKDITVDFWYPGDFTAAFKYKPETNTYLRFMGYDETDAPLAHLDQETKEQIEVKNLIVQFVTEAPVEGDDKSRLTYELIGSGKGLVFIDGKVIEVTWSKAERDSRTLFYDTNGKPLEFNRGKFWISVVPDRNTAQVVYN
ncbi:DUF3048 domain-containing protein [Patescibacteria group bacterium]|nr:DUF3048 domain-containing protein [Patescibacteria group bacterium]